MFENDESAPSPTVMADCAGQTISGIDKNGPGAIAIVGELPNCRRRIMELTQNSQDECTLRNDENAVIYHVAITGDVFKDINVPELQPNQDIQFELAPPAQRRSGELRVTWETHLGEKQVLTQALH